MGNYALVKMVNSIETVTNVIVAEPEVASTYLGEYDYVLDTSMYDPQPGPGWSYDAGLDEFSPPPHDYQADLQYALIAIDAAITSATAAYLDCDPGQQSAAIGIVMDSLSEAPQAEIDAMLAAIAYLTGE